MRREVKSRDEAPAIQIVSKEALGAYIEYISNVSRDDRDKMASIK